MKKYKDIKYKKIKWHLLSEKAKFRISRSLKW